MTTSQRTAAKAIESGEAEATFEFGGVSYVVPPSEMWPIEVVEAAEDGKETKAIRLLLGEDQWAKFRASDRGSTLKDLRDLFEAAGKAVGSGN